MNKLSIFHYTGIKIILIFNISTLSQAIENGICSQWWNWASNKGQNRAERDFSSVFNVSKNYFSHLNWKQKSKLLILIVVHNESRWGHLTTHFTVSRTEKQIFHQQNENEDIFFSGLKVFCLAPIFLLFLCCVRQNEIPFNSSLNFCG